MRRSSTVAYQVATLSRFQFDPSYKTVARVKPLSSHASLKEEVNMRSVPLQKARLSAGPLILSILDNIPPEYHSYAKRHDLAITVDSRIHQLHKGEHPAEPGWHCDSPYDQSAIYRYFLLCTLSTHTLGVSNTEFLKAPSALLLNVPHSISTNELWNTVDTTLKDDSKTKVASMKDGALTCMSNRTLHRAAPAKHNGMRLFVRINQQIRTASINDDSTDLTKGLLPGIRV